MKGMATVRMLRQLEQRTGRHISELFDLIVGTSTGGLLAVALGLRRMSMDDAEDIYKVGGGWLGCDGRGLAPGTLPFQSVVFK